MSSVAFVRVCDTESVQPQGTFPADVPVTSIVLRLAQQVKAGDFLLLIVASSADRPPSFAITHRASSLGTWDAIGAFSTREQHRYGCLVRFPLEAGDEITLTAVGDWYPTSYIATLLQFSDVLSISDSRYTSQRTHFALHNQTNYGLGGLSTDSNTDVADGGGPNPARSLAVADIGTGQSTPMIIATTVSGSPLDQSMWTERLVETLPEMDASWADSLSRSMGVFTRSFDVDTLSVGFKARLPDFQGADPEQTNAWVTLKPGFRLAFEILSACDASPKRWVSIALDNGETHYSNEAGEAYFTVAAGTYVYTITFSDYTTVTGSVTVTDDTTVQVALTPTSGCPPTAGIGSGIANDGSPDCAATAGVSTVTRSLTVRGVVGATVTLDGTAAGTIGADGTLVISGVSRAAHTIVVSKTGYESVTTHVPAA